MPQVSGAQRDRQERRVWWSSFIGAAMEFYDFGIFVAASAVVFGPLFFSRASPDIATVLAFATLAIGYAARPLGAVIFGHFGDRIGRKSMLLATMTIMGVATFLIGCLPTAEQVGDFAPIMLVILRLIQGVAVGGEFGGAVTMTTEFSTAKRRGIAGSATNSGGSFGLGVGFCVFALVSVLSNNNLTGIAWRIPFWMTLVLFVAAVYIRTRIEESPVMKAELARGGERPAPIVEVATKHWRQWLQGTAIVAGVFASSQFVNSFLVAYGVSQLGYTSATMLWVTTIMLFVLALVTPFAARLGDRVGRRRLILIGTVLMMVFAGVVWPMMHSGVVVIVGVAYILYALIYALSFGPQPAVLTELFPTSSRYTGIGLCFQCGALISGLTPLVYSLLIAEGFGEISVAIVLIALLLIAVVGVLTLPKRDDVQLTEVGQTHVDRLPEVVEDPRRSAGEPSI